MMWIILFTNVILLFRNVILQTKTIILLSTKIISLAKIIQNKITLKSTLHSLTFNFAPVLFTNRKSDFLQCMPPHRRSYISCKSKRGYLFKRPPIFLWMNNFQAFNSHPTWESCLQLFTQCFLTCCIMSCPLLLIILVKVVRSTHLRNFNLNFITIRVLSPLVLNLADKRVDKLFNGNLQ